MRQPHDSSQADLQQHQRSLSGVSVPVTTTPAHHEAGSARTVRPRLARFRRIVGGGIDFRLGSVFTLGLAGAWNWSSGLRDDFWSAPAFNGGEFTFTMGWQFGR